jgi:two-component system sensor histidine kinase YesM
MGVYLYRLNSDSAVGQARLIMEQNLLQTKASILQKEKVIENSAHVLLNEKFLNFLNSGYDNEIYRVEDYQFDFSPSVKNILQQNNSIYTVRIYMDKAIIVEMMDSYYSVRAVESPRLYQDMLKFEPQKDGWRSTHDAVPHILRSRAGSPIQVFSFSKAIYPRNYQYRRGILEVEIKESVLFDMLRDPVIRNLGQVFVVDSAHRIVSNNIPELFRNDISSTGFNNFVTGQNISQIKKVNRVPSIVISIPITEINCSIVGIFPISSFNGEINKSLWRIIGVLMISSLLLGLIIYFITNVLLGRVKKLVKAMKQVKEENLDVSVPVTAMDEFGELALSFNHMTRRIHELVEMVYKIKIMEREAELKAWESQINPHFLYNTLATISWAARKAGSQEIMQISNSLAKFYRLVLSKGNSLISVREELDMVMAFLQIQKIRFEDKFDVRYDIDGSIYEHKIIKNLLQPIVENALNHGIDPKRTHGTIIIKAMRHDGKLIFKVIDDGVGMDASTLNEVIMEKVERSSGSGYAIKNIIERLKAYYGPGYTFEIFSQPGMGTSVTITIQA